MEDTRHTLLVALIPVIKGAHMKRKKGESSLRKNNREKQKENRE